MFFFVFLTERKEIFKTVLFVPFADWLLGPLVAGCEGVGVAGRHGAGTQGFFWLSVTLSPALQVALVVG